ncbi:MAG: methyltransferase domain-containing protein [Candidatus Acidiferrum sp.]
MYSLSDYGSMIADGWRFAAYAKAIARAVRPGDAVAEIGCGPGVFSLLACRAGARRVFAIETDDCIQFARQLANANGLADRIEFLQQDSRQVELPERVNVIVSDIRGSLPLSGFAVPAIDDARRRLLAPGGILIPQRDTLKAAVVEAREYYESLAAPWKNRVDGFDLSSSLALVLNEKYGVTFKREQLVAEPLTWHVLDYTAAAAKRASGAMRFRVERSGTAHGLCLWFETQLFEDIGYSSGPGGASTIYGHTFLPWLEPVCVAEGQEIQVELHADLVGGDYIWRWEAKMELPDRTARHFRQSTFQGANFVPQSMQRRAANFVPELSETGEAERWILQAMDGKASLQNIAQEAAARFPRQFSSWEEAFRRAAEISGKYSR